ncbi:hypothetical protein [Gracilibacillus boraciitolerans]|nr:hypothetical protein [Gracilibacillus boraciitolerans]
MMRRGIMIFDVKDQKWKLWFGQQSYDTFEGMYFGIRILNHYHRTSLGKEEGWFVTMEKDVSFDLRIFEVYKIRIISTELLTLFDDAPF